MDFSNESFKSCSPCNPGRSSIDNIPVCKNTQESINALNYTNSSLNSTHSENRSYNNLFVNSLLQDYQSVSDELASSLKKFKAEKVLLENELMQLQQENEYLDSEIYRQQVHLDNLTGINYNISEKLLREEAETKRIVELKLLEIQDIFESIYSVDIFLSNFKKDFSEKVLSDADQFRECIKIKLKDLKENSLKESDDYLNEVDNCIQICYEGFNETKKAITAAEMEVEDGIIDYRNKSQEVDNFKQKLKDALLLLESEQKREKELQMNLIHYNNMIVMTKEDHSNKRKTYETEISNLTNEITQLKHKNNILNDDIGKKKTELANLKAIKENLLLSSSSLQGAINKKRSDNDIIDQEIKNLEEELMKLKEKNVFSNSEIQKRCNVKKDLKDREDQLAILLEKINELNKIKEETVLLNPTDKLAASEKSLEQMKSLNQQMQTNVENINDQLNETLQTEKILKEERDSLRESLNKKLLLLEKSADGEMALEIIRKENEKFPLKIKSCELEIEKKKKIILSLQEYLEEQIKIYDEYLDEFEKSCQPRDNNQVDELFEKYLSTIEEMENLQIDNLDCRVKSVTSDIDFNKKQREETIEHYKNEMNLLQDSYNEVVKNLNNEVEEHKKHCGDMLAKMDSEMRYIQGKIPNVVDVIKAKKDELTLHLPKLITSVKTALKLFDKIIDYYGKAFDERQSAETTSLHWDNMKEVLQEILLYPINKLSKLRGMPAIDTLSATPKVYRTVIMRAHQMFLHIVNTNDKKSTEHTCRKLLEMHCALYYQRDSADTNTSNKLNDTLYSTSPEDEVLL